MPYLIDGNNLGGALGGAAGARDRGLVLRWLLDWSRSGRRAVVVFDGAPDDATPTAYGSVRVRYAGSRSADVVIRSLVADEPGQWVVVTDDAALRRACREHGGRVLSSRDLLRTVSSPPEKASGKPRGPVDVDEWLAYFESDDREG